MAEYILIPTIRYEDTGMEKRGMGFVINFIGQDFDPFILWITFVFLFVVHIRYALTVFLPNHISYLDNAVHH